MTNKDYILRIAESKTRYHKQKAKMSFEEKIKIIVDLQKLDFEIIKNNKKRKSSNKQRTIWQLDN